MDTRPTNLRWHGVLLAGLVALSGGCYHTKELVVPPPEGAVPTESNPVTLPRYVISPPDILLVQVLQPPYQHYLPTRQEADEAQKKEAEAAAVAAGKAA